MLRRRVFNSRVAWSVIAIIFVAVLAFIKRISVVAYLNMAARNAERVAGPMGEFSYYGQLKFGPAAARELVIDVCKDHSHIGIGVPQGFGGEYKYWSIHIGADAPKEVGDLLNFLTEDQYRGQVLPHD